MQLGSSTLSLTNILTVGRTSETQISALGPTGAALFSGQIAGTISTAQPAYYMSTGGDIASTVVQTSLDGMIWSTQGETDTLPAGMAVRVVVTDTIGTIRYFAITSAVEPAISAVTEPNGAPLLAGQSVSDMAGFAAFTAPENFLIRGVPATAQEVTITFDGDAQDAGTALQEGQTAGYRVTVNDGDSPRDYVVAPVTVGYALKVTVTGHQLEIDVTDLLPADTDVLVQFNAPSQLSTYDIGLGTGVGRFNASLAAAGPAQIFAPQIAADLDPPEMLTATHGLYHGTGPGGDITQTGQWHDANGPIAGAVGLAFNTPLAGETYRYVETLSDANGTQVYSSNILTIGV